MDLLEREHELGVLRAALTEAAAGEGSGVAVVGESGAGKSALLERAVADAVGLRVLRGGCDPLRTPRPLGPFRDIASALGLGPLVGDEDHRLSEVCEEISACLATEPTVLVVEDLHWVDAASVDVLRFLARRISALPLALLVSYRDQEIGPRHSARPLLGDVARLDGLTTLRLPPLSLGAVGALLSGTGMAAGRVHAVTGGNPFFVAEVAKDPGLPLPASVRDAVLARTSDVADPDFEVLQLIACAPDRLDDRALPALGVDLATLQRLDATGLLGRLRGGLVFRHELARQAVESTIPTGGAPELHARLLDALEGIEPREPAVLAHHAVAARDAVRAVSYAREAGIEASHAASHSDAAAFFQTAVHHLVEAPPAERADLLQRLSFEQYMTSRLAEAIDNVRATFPLWREAGDIAGLARAYDTCSIYLYYSARRDQAEEYADRAADIADESGAEVALGVARATRGFLAYMRNELDLALECAAESAKVAGEHDEAALALRTEFVRTLAELSGGEEEVRARMADNIETARASDWDELASTGYSHLANLDVEQRRFRSAQHVLDESIPFAQARDIPICIHWQTAVRSRLHFVQGRWDAGLEDAEAVLDSAGMPLARLWPHLVTYLVPLRRGEEDLPEEHLQSAWELAELLDEPLRRLPVLSALAERMWMSATGDLRVTDTAVRDAERYAEVPGAAWGVGELAGWLLRLGLPVPDGAVVAEPVRLAVDGRVDESAAWWRRTGEPFAEAMVWGDSPDPAHRARAVELLDRLGATGTADRHRVALRRDGVLQVPQRPRESTRANPGGLTNRQLDVARLVARGFTNAEIATRLFISPKTADHHVSAVLLKLGVPNRRAVMMLAPELALD